MSSVKFFQFKFFLASLLSASMAVAITACGEGVPVATNPVIRESAPASGTEAEVMSIESEIRLAAASGRIFATDTTTIAIFDVALALAINRLPSGDLAAVVTRANTIAGSDIDLADVELRINNVLGAGAGIAELRASFAGATTLGETGVVAIEDVAVLLAIARLAASATPEQIATRANSVLGRTGAPNAIAPEAVGATPAQPIPTPTPAASPSPGPSASPSPGPSASPSPGPSASPSPAPSASPSPTPTPQAMNEIAFVVLDNTGSALRVDSILPDGSGRRTIWNAPSPLPNGLSSLAWKPDGTELAFDSDHEAAFSTFGSDLFAISPDGNNLRRITNAPSYQSVQSGNFAEGAVQVTITNNYPDSQFLDVVSPINLYIEGAVQPVPFTLPPFGTSLTISVNTIADLGSRGQFVVLNYASSSCQSSKDVYPGVDIQPDQVLQISLTFEATNCQSANTPASNFILDSSWQFNGSDVGFIFGSSPLRVPANGGTLDDIAQWFPGFTSQIDWSPLNEDVLFAQVSQGIAYLPAGGSAQILINDSVLTPDNPEWFPNGTQVAFEYGSELAVASIANPVITPVTATGSQGIVSEEPSISPNGRFIAFTLRSGGVRNIAILDLQTQTITPITSDGLSRTPAWSPR